MFVWLNGEILPVQEARISVLDRGFLFGDGVYEMVRVVDGVPLRVALHAERLRRSLALARMDGPDGPNGIAGFDVATLGQIVQSLVAAEGLPDATVYLQVTRGAMGFRRHLPDAGMRPTVVAFAASAPGLDELGTPLTCRAALRPDTRWLRCSIKATSLLGNVLGVMEAFDQGADEAILARHAAGPAAGPADDTVDSAGLNDGDLVGEGATSNVWAVLEGEVVTPPLDSDPPILHGVTRRAALDAADRIGLPVHIGPITVGQLRSAPEIFLTSARRLVASVVSLDGRPVGGGAPGPIASALAAAMRDDIVELVSGSVAEAAAGIHSTEPNSTSVSKS